VVSEEDFEPRPNDFLVEPMFAPFEKEEEPEPEPTPEPPPPTLLARLRSFFLRG